jgi:hypothetical protein
MSENDPVRHISRALEGDYRFICKSLLLITEVEGSSRLMPLDTAVLGNLRQSGTRNWVAAVFQRCGAGQLLTNAVILRPCAFWQVLRPEQSVDHRQR